MIFEIPAWVVALSALVLTISLIATKDRVPLRIFSFWSMMLCLIYSAFAVFQLPVELRQFITRLNAFSMNIALTAIILVTRMKHNGK